VALHSKRCNVLFYVVSTDDIEDCVYASTVRCSFHFFNKILRCVIDNYICTKVFAGLHFSRRTGHDDACADCLTNLNCCSTDTRCTSVHHGPTARCKSALYNKGIPRRDEHFRNSCSLMKCHTCRNSHGLTLVQHQLFGVCTTTHYSHDMVTHAPCSNPLAHCFHCSRKFQTRNLWTLRKRIGIEPHALQKICSVQSRCRNGNEDVLCAIDRRRNILESKNFGPTVLAENDGLHDAYAIFC
jgi:hypothetical protein